MSKLVIKQFGPIDNLELNISKQFNVVIGEQATGKSTIAKAIAFFNNVSQMVYYGIMECYQKNKDKVSRNVMQYIKDNMSQHLVDNFGLTYFQEGSLIEYFFRDDVFLKVSFIKQRFAIAISEELERIILSKVGGIIDPLMERMATYEDISKNTNMLCHKIESEISELLFVLIPAGRTTAIAIEDKPQRLGNGSFKSDPVMGEFLNSIFNYRRNQKMGVNVYWQNLCQKYAELNSSLLIVDRLAVDILRGKYMYHDDGDTIWLEDEKVEIPLYCASSGQQEVVWIINFLRDELFSGKPVFFIIEEPESHLYPKAQIALVKFIAFVTKKLNGGCLITTHSPYVLSGFNLLAHVGRLQSKNIQCSQIEIEDKCSIPFGSLDAYKLEREEYGSILRNIVDKESGMIDTLEIDEASAEVNKMTDNLYELEFGNEV